MTTVAGVFRSRERAEHAAVDLRQTGLRSINLLIPGATASQVDAVPTTETEQPGMGKAIGGVLGGALGMAAGMELGAAAATLCYQATALGLHTHQMGGFDRDVARKAFNIPDDFLLGAVIALGYQGNPSVLTIPFMVEQETSPRQRKPLTDFVFSAWNEPAKLG